MKCDHAVCNSVGAVFADVLFIDDRVEGLAVWHKCRLLLNQREEKLTTRLGAGPKPNQLPEDHRLFFSKGRRRAYGPHLPCTFHCVEVVRRCTLSQAFRKGHRTSSHNGGISSDTTLSLVIAALLPRGLEPTLIMTCNAFSCFDQRSN